MVYSWSWIIAHYCPKKKLQFKLCFFKDLNKVSYFTWQKLGRWFSRLYDTKRIIWDQKIKPNFIVVSQKSLSLPYLRTPCAHFTGKIYARISLFNTLSDHSLRWWKNNRQASYRPRREIALRSLVFSRLPSGSLAPVSCILLCWIQNTCTYFIV